MITVETAQTNEQRRQFVKLPYGIYKDIPQWTPMISGDASKLVHRRGSQLFANGEQEFYLAYDGGVPVGRICVGIDRAMNKHKGVNHAYFTLFETRDDAAVADSLLATAADWAKRSGAAYLKGPVSPTNGDDFRGILVEGFEQPAYILNSYTPRYYVDFFSEFDEYLEYYGYLLNLAAALAPQVVTRIVRVLNRFTDGGIESDSDDPDALLKRVFESFYEGRGFSIVDAHSLSQRVICEGVYPLLKEAIPDWDEDIIPPTSEEITALVKDFLRFAQPGMAEIVYHKQRMVGFALVLPNYDPVIRKIRGRLLPMGWFRLLRAKGTMDTARAVLLFVSSDYRNDAVSGALIIKLRENLIKLGYKKVEFSTISATNKQMVATARFLGMQPYKRYIVFGKSLTGQPLSPEQVYGRAAGRPAVRRRSSGRTPSQEA